MASSTSPNDPDHDAFPDTRYALADSYAHPYDGIQRRKRATRLVVTPGGFLRHQLAPPSHASPPFGALLAAGASGDEDVSPAGGPPDSSADFRSGPQELFSSLPAANDLHIAGIAHEENAASPPLRFETPEPFLGDHDDPNAPFRPAAPPSVHNHQAHDSDNNDKDNDAASPPDVKVILSSETPAPSPFVQGTQRRATSSPACTSTPPAYTIHPTLISTSSPAPLPSSSPSTLPTNPPPSLPLQSSLSLLPTAVVANTTSTGAPLAGAGAGTALPMAFGALHTVPFYVSVVFGSIAAAALLAALVAWAFRFRSAARVRREERIFGFPGTGNAGGGGGGDGGDGGGWAAWWSRPFMDRVASGRESLATIETSSVADASYVSARPQPIVGPPISGVGSVGVAGVGGVGGGGVSAGSGNVGGGGGGGAVPAGVWREWEQATGMSFGRAMGVGVGSGTDVGMATGMGVGTGMGMHRTVSSKRRHQARAANAANTGEFKGDGDGGEFGGEFGGVRKVGGFYVHPPPQMYDAPTVPLENPFAPAPAHTNPYHYPYPSSASTSESAPALPLPLAPQLALARSSSRTRGSERTGERGAGERGAGERGAGRGRVGLPRMDSLGSGVGLGLGLEFSGSSDLDYLPSSEGDMGGVGCVGGMGGMGSMLRVTNRAAGDGMSVRSASASRANTAMGMREDGDADEDEDEFSPTPSTSTSAFTVRPASTARPAGSDAGKTPTAGPLPSFPSFPAVLHAIKTTFGAAFSPSVSQGRGEAQRGEEEEEEDRYTRAPERCGVKKTRKWAQMGVDAPVEEREGEGEGEKEKEGEMAEREMVEREGTQPLSVSKKHSRRYPSAAGPSSNSAKAKAKRLSLMRGVSARRVGEAFGVGLSKRGRGMRRLGSSASRMSRGGGSRLGARSSTRGSGERGNGERGNGGWEDLDARSDYGFDADGDNDNDYGGDGDDDDVDDDDDDEEEEEDGGRPRFLSRPSAASFLSFISSVSGVSAFSVNSVDSVNSSREELMR
ncbi:hypothetical protein PC9H_001770 [Pleurotus ostreatus]|uniref:Uncharacterized protein n=1 Tax=Pleurotus ostreatus TaxID=5322 RepID=A0A8H6ZHA1_PLEOS|nr:uncharacterized protein PC9H_001770 [Pleurotus ostreatus]KAF7419185.1 hypothetical protein PC9H_001770 [Pleurotus ostreatus]